MHRPFQLETKVVRTAIGVALLGAMLAGCVDSLYSERRETISPLAGDARSVNRVTQIVDPWSKASANNNIVYSGDKMQSASERYRMGKVIRPVNATTSSFSNSQAEQAAQTATSGQTSTPSSSTVK